MEKRNSLTVFLSGLPNAVLDPDFVCDISFWNFTHFCYGTTYQLKYIMTYAYVCPCVCTLLTHLPTFLPNSFMCRQRQACYTEQLFVPQQTNLDQRHVIFIVVNHCLNRTFLAEQACKSAEMICLFLNKVMLADKFICHCKMKIIIIWFSTAGLYLKCPYKLFFVCLIKMKISHAFYLFHLI